MHYYKRNLGDYAKKAGRLSMLQHGAYNLLIDACYDRERFPTREEAIHWTWASTREEIEAVEFVLSRFFELQDDVYVQSRIQQEIDDYRQKAEKNRRIAHERETKRKEKSTNRARTVNEAPPNQEPITTNHEPLTTNHYYKSESSGEDSPPPRVPYKKIVDLYHELLPMCPRVVKLTDTRKGYIKQRWREDLETLEQWENYLRYVGESDFLTGRAQPSNGKPPFVADLEWLTRPSNIVKVAEGKYHRSK